MNTLNLKQAAELLKTHPQTVLQRVRSGVIPAAKPGKCLVFIEEDLIQWLRSLYNKGGDARQGGQALCSLKEKTRSYGGTNTKLQTAKLYANLLGLPTEPQAQELADTCKAQAWRISKLKEKPRYTWQDAVVKWLQESQKRTLKEDQANFKWLDGYLGHKVLAEVDQTDIDQIITAKLNEGVSNARVNRITALVSAVLNKSRIDWGLIPFRQYVNSQNRKSVSAG